MTRQSLVLCYWLLCTLTGYACVRKVEMSTRIGSRDNASMDINLVCVHRSLDRLSLQMYLEAFCT